MAVVAGEVFVDRIDVEKAVAFRVQLVELFPAAASIFVLPSAVLRRPSWQRKRPGHSLWPGFSAADFFRSQA